MLDLLKQRRLSTQKMKRAMKRGKISQKMSNQPRRILKRKRKINLKRLIKRLKMNARKLHKKAKARPRMKMRNMEIKKAKEMTTTTENMILKTMEKTTTTRKMQEKKERLKIRRMK
jgi:hypothetical protein